MKIGLLLGLFNKDTMEDALDKARNLGLDTVEIGTGNYPGDSHCKLNALLKDSNKRKDFLETVKSRGLEISALSCHGNVLHPDPKIGNAHHEVFEKTILLAEKLGIKTVNNFSGCPGGGPGDKTPNWVTCPWPTDYSDIIKWQWEKRVIPYWKKMAKFAKGHGVR